MKKIYLLLTTIATITACSSGKQEITNVELTIDSTLQVKTTAILENNLSEFNTLSGQAIVMEVQTGQIKALVTLVRNDEGNNLFLENHTTANESELIKTASILAALESGKTLISDTVDTGDGVYSVYGNELKDHNWSRGGYGVVTLQEGALAGSNIAIYKSLEKCFGDNPQSYFDLLAKMDYGKPDSIKGLDSLKPAIFVTPKETIWEDASLAWSCIGYHQRISPLQILTFYNAIANNGKMVQPQLYKDSTVVINPQIASKQNIDIIRETLALNVTNWLGKDAQSNKIAVAGKQGTCQVSINEDDEANTQYAAEFCGYFPIDNPQYTIIISINKMGLPVSGGLMAGTVFREIVDSMVE